MDKDKGESILKETMRHVGLYAGLIAYTAVGAKVSSTPTTIADHSGNRRAYKTCKKNEIMKDMNLLHWTTYCNPKQL